MTIIGDLLKTMPIEEKHVALPKENRVTEYFDINKFNKLATTRSDGGLPNIGNTCYINSVLQIIAHLYGDNSTVFTKLLQKNW